MRPYQGSHIPADIAGKRNSMTESNVTPQTSVSTELAMRRTGMAFQRTRMAADRTLMAIIRTSLSLIGFGFTISQFFNKLKEAGVLPGAAPARHFGLSLVLLGVGMLGLGIVYHLLYMRGLREERRQMQGEGFIHGQSKFPPSLTLIVAVLLFFLGCLTLFGLLLRIGPFG
jgi:putative membrane protein